MRISDEVEEVRSTTAISSTLVASLKYILYPIEVPRGLPYGGEVDQKNVEQASRRDYEKKSP